MAPWGAGLMAWEMYQGGLASRPLPAPPPICSAISSSSSQGAAPLLTGTAHTGAILTMGTAGQQELSRVASAITPS